MHGYIPDSCEYTPRYQGRCLGKKALGTVPSYLLAGLISLYAEVGPIYADNVPINSLIDKQENCV